MELNEEALRKIILKVIEEYKGFNSSEKRILTVYTGGKIGFESGLQQINQLAQHELISFDLIFSKAAHRIHDEELIKDILDVEELIGDGKVYSQLSEFDLILVPILTRNSAAKLAAQITDTVPTNIIFQALLRGIPILAARNSADLTDPQCLAKGMDSAPKVLLQENKEQLIKLTEFGIKLVDAAELASEVEDIIFSSKAKPIENINLQKSDEAQKSTQSKVDEASCFEGKLLTYKDIRVLQDRQIDKILIQSDTVITPLARETASENGVKICLQQK